MEALTSLFGSLSPHGRVTSWESSFASDIVDESVMVCRILVTFASSFQTKASL